MKERSHPSLRNSLMEQEEYTSLGFKDKSCFESQNLQELFGSLLFEECLTFNFPMKDVLLVQQMDERNSPQIICNCKLVRGNEHQSNPNLQVTVMRRPIVEP
jgi:hypothetical protein